MQDPPERPDPKKLKYELTWTSTGPETLNPRVEASLKSAIIAALDGELAKGLGPRTPTGFPREIKINARIVWPKVEER
jgi:hypothetical protein